MFNPTTNICISNFSQLPSSGVSPATSSSLHDLTEAEVSTDQQLSPALAARATSYFPNQIWSYELYKRIILAFVWVTSPKTTIAFQEISHPVAATH